MVAIGRLCFAKKLDVMNECDAPELNQIVAGCELARNIPSTTSWACWASSLVIWLTLSYMINDQLNYTWNKLHHYSFLELVHSVRLEQLGEGLAVSSSETIVAHYGVVLVVEASASRNSDIASRNLVAASIMEDAIHASVGEPYSGFWRKTLAEASEALCCSLKTGLGIAISAFYSSPSSWSCSR
jgi:hypothetical protein